MRRFFRKALLVTLVLSTALLGLTGCEGILGNIGGFLGGGQGGTVNGSHEHIWGAWQTKEAATCISTGLEERSCKLCDAVENRTTEITDNHNFQSDVCVWCGHVFGLDDYFNFTMLQDGTYAVTAKQYVPKNLIVPSEYKGAAVTVIGESAFSRCNFIETVEIPDSIVRIESGAFMACTNLTKIDIPASVGQIDEFAFINCTAALQSITVEKANTKYHSESNCLIETASNILILGCKSSIIPDYVTAIGSDAFRGCVELAQISLHEGISQIGDHAFDGCSSLVSISLPESVTSIGLGAFSDCTSLTSFTIPRGVKRIEQNTFNNCTSLKSLYIPATVTSIQGNNPFRGCAESLESIEVDEDNPYYESVSNCLIDKWEASLILGCKNSIIPDTVTDIGQGAFYGCVGLTEITIPSSVTRIGEFAFANCTGLVSIVLPNGLETIRSSTFYQCAKLQSIEIPDGVTAINERAFWGCTSLSAITLPDTVSQIERFAFYGCRGLQRFTFPESTTFVGDDAFSNCFNIHTVTVNKGEHLQYINSMVFGNCTKIVELYNLSDAEIVLGQDGYGSILRDDIKVIHTSNEEPSVVERVGDYLFATLDEELYLLGYVGGESELVLPDSYEGSPYSIYDYAFCNDQHIAKVTLSDGVLSVGMRAFMDCYNLISLTINKDLTAIGDEVFYNCDRLVEIYNPSAVRVFGYAKAVHASLSEPSIIHKDGEFLFIEHNGKNYLLGYVGDQTEIRLPSSYNGGAYEILSFAFARNQQIHKVTIPSGVSAIGQGAFQSCQNLLSAVFESGSTIAEIPYQAFEECTGLTSIALPESVSTIADSAFRGCTSLVHLEITENLTDVSKTAFDLCEGVVNQYKNFRYIGAGNNPYYILLGPNDSMGYPATPVTSCDVFYRTRIIASNAFYDCKDLERIAMNDGLISIGSYAFSGCESLTAVSIPDTVKKIGRRAFNECSSICEVDISDGVACIDEGAFYGCSSLMSLTIPKSVCVIGKDAFLGCGKLVEIYNLSTVEIDPSYISSDIFVVHSSANEKSIIQKSGEFLFVTHEGKSYLMGYVGNQTDIVLPSDYNGTGYEIYGSAFYGRDDLTSVVISEGVTAIGASAFYGCMNLKKVTIGKNVSQIGYGAFGHAGNLNEAVFANPSNWYRDMYMKFEEKDLADTSIAASYLRGQYAFKIWQRK